MTSLVTLAQALGIAYASGISLYATVALLGIAARWGLVPALPAPLDVLDNPWIVGLALLLTVVEFLATLIPGIASAWRWMRRRNQSRMEWQTSANWPWWGSWSRWYGDIHL